MEPRGNPVRSLVIFIRVRLPRRGLHRAISGIVIYPLANKITNCIGDEHTSITNHTGGK